jgi:hypothetical protein
MTTMQPVMTQDQAEHFYKWLEKTVYRDEQHTVEEQIHALLRDHPDLVNTRTWTEMRNMAQHINIEG